jgi:predicted DNA-binding WGR domain protein
MPPKRKASSADEEATSFSSSKSGVLRYLTCKEGNSDKFYEISLSPDFNVISRYGRTGSEGVSVISTCADVAEAMRYVDKLTAAKKKKGYVESSVSGGGAKESDQKPAKSAKTSKAEVPAPVQKPAAEPKKKPEAKKVDKSSAASQPAAEKEGPAPVYLECIDGSSSKFWEATQAGGKVIIRFGRIGSDGTRTEKDFGGDTAAAAKFAEKMTNEKLKKGYKVAVDAAKAGAADYDGPTYFVSMSPKEETYRGEDETVEYDIFLRELTVDGARCSLLEWFESAWRASADGEDAAEEHVLAALSIPDMQSVHGIWGLWDEDERPKTFKPLNNEAKLKAWLSSNLAVEREVVIGQHGILIGSTGEFDVDYAFFRPQALAAGELGKHLTPLLKYDEATNTVTAVQPTIRYTAYL